MGAWLTELNLFVGMSFRSEPGPGTRELAPRQNLARKLWRAVLLLARLKARYQVHTSDSSVSVQARTDTTEAETEASLSCIVL